MPASQTPAEAVHAIQPYLAQLLEAPTAQQLQGRLEALRGTPNEQTASLELLQQYDTTREWLRLYTDEHLAAANILPHMRQYSPLVGSTNTIESPHYVCPVASCHQEWYRNDAAQTIPRCPIHDLQLVRESKLEAP